MKSTKIIPLLVQHSINVSAVRSAAATPALARLIRRHGDLSDRLAALQVLYADVLSRPIERGQEPESHEILIAKMAARAGVTLGLPEQRDAESSDTDSDYSTNESDVPDIAVSNELAQEISVLRREKARLSVEITRRFPAYAALMAPELPTLDRVQRRLKPNQALIATYTGEAETYVWAVPKHGKTAFAVVPMGQAKLTAMVNKLRLSIKPTGKTLDRVPKFNVETAHDLYLALLAPVAAGWKSAKDLLVVAHGPLGQVPFSVLVTRKTGAKDGWADLPFAAYRRVPWLARSHSVTALPTVAALITLRELPPPASGRRPFAGFADPWFSRAQAEKARSQGEPRPVLANFTPASGRHAPILLRSSPDLERMPSATLADLQRLPDTAQEVRSIARALKADPVRDLFIGPRANEHRVKTMKLDRYKVIAFASHALLAGSLDGLTQPALAMTAPAVAGIKGDGLLTMGEILALKLDADWVVLSACNTAAANGAGAEAVSGLGRAFLYAGTRSLLVTHWPIESKSARSLVTDLFKRQAADPRLSRAQALRRAKLGMIDGPGFVDARGRTIYSYAHPLFWAPFQLFGEGAASTTARKTR